MDTQTAENPYEAIADGVDSVPPPPPPPPPPLNLGMDGVPPSSPGVDIPPPSPCILPPSPPPVEIEAPQLNEQPAAVTIQEAVEQVDAVVSLLGAPGAGLLVMDDGSAVLQASPITACYYTADMDSGLSDRENYPTTMNSGLFHQEAESKAIMMDMIKQGRKHQATLYSWRSCAQAIPVVKSQDHPNRMAIYKMTVEVLKPEVQKLHDLLKFLRLAIKTLCDEVKRLCGQRNQQSFISDLHLLTIGEFMEMIVTLDELKNIMASIKNDHSAYKRAFEIACKEDAMKTMQEFQEMSMFLGTHNHTRTALKTALQEIVGYEEVLCDVYETCMKVLDTQGYIRYKTRHSLLKILGLSLFFMDNVAGCLHKIESKRKLHLGKLDKLFKVTETIPVYGDIMVVPFSYIEAMPSYESSRWPHCATDEVSSQSSFITRMPAIRTLYSNLMCELALADPMRVIPASPEQRTQDEASESTRLYKLALKALQAVSSWTNIIVELISWKLAHPTDHRDSKCPVDAEEYERATRYNYTSKEKSCITELITLVKSIQHTLQRLQLPIRAATQRHIYTQTQHLVQRHLREVFRKSFKSKKEQLKSLIFSIQESCADWLDGVRPLDDPALKGKKDSKSGYQPPALQHKTTPPTHTQLYILMSRLEFMVDKQLGKKGYRKDLDMSHVQVIESFLQTSQYWQEMLNFSDTLNDCCDLSQLWYREFYLNITKDRIQFPIQMSMPWILTEHILESSQPAMTESLLYVLDLYNDSAQSALKMFNKQYLYTELEAEVDLCFAQLVFQLTEKIFSYYKQLAGMIVLRQKCRTWGRREGVRWQWPKDMHYEKIMCQRQLNLLGRTVNLNKLLSYRINSTLVKCLEVAINYFQSDDITKIIELEGLLEVNRMTHKLLSKHFTLDSFSSLFNEANHCVTSPYGYVQLHVFSELNYYFLPNYCYNGSTGRFVFTILSMFDKVERDKRMKATESYLWGSKFLQRCFSSMYLPYQGFVGTPHINAMVRILGYQSIALVLIELKKVVNSLLNSSLKPYVNLLLNSLPKRIKLPLYQYGSPGILQYYQEMLKDIMSYSDLQPKVFQTLRELGNAILFTSLLANALAQEEICDLKHIAPFQNIIPKPYIPDKENMSKEERNNVLKTKMAELEKKYYSQQVVPIISKKGTAEQKKLVEQNALLSREKLCIGLGVFAPWLKSIRDFLTDPLWHGDGSSDGSGAADSGSGNSTAAINITGSDRQFHRLWSVIQFIYCMPARSDNEFTVEQLFGEGLQWGGCALLVLLKQREKFENLDFSYHLLKVNRVDMKTGTTKGIEIQKMADRIRKFQILNQQIFSVLEKYLGDADHYIHVDTSRVIHFSPPSADIATKQGEQSEEKVKFDENDNVSMSDDGDPGSRISFV